MESAEIHPPDRGLLHALRQEPMANVSDRGYKVRIETIDGEARSGADVRLRLRVSSPSGVTVKAFEEDMTKLMHFIVVSADLSSFVHLHPEYDGDGEFEVTARFPFGGKFLLVSEFMPENEGITVYTQWLTVKGESHAAVPLAPDTNFVRTIGGVQATMSLTPGASDLRAKEMTMINMRFSDAKTGKPAELEKFLGTAGHAVILNDKADRYVHVHAMPEMSSGSSVMFHAEFPTAGTYKIWVQTQRQGKVLTFPFVVSVR